MTGNPQEQQRHGLDGFFGWLRGLGIQRNTDDKWMAGVCSGIANRLGIDPVLIRGALLLLVIFGGFGVVVYLIAWALIPDQDGRIVAENGVRHGDGGGIFLLVIIGIALFSDLSDRWWLWMILLPASIIGWWFYRSTKAGKTQEEMGQEAEEFAHRMAKKVENWGAGQGSSRATAGTEGGPAAEASPPYGGPGATGTGSPYAGSAPAGAPSPVWTPPQPARAPHGMGPGRTGTVAPPPPRVVQRRRRRAGLLGLLLTLGLALAAYGAGTQAAPRISTTATPEVIGLAMALAAAGLALVLIGLVGRRAGFTGFLVTLLAAGAVLSTTASPDLVRSGLGHRTWVASSQPVGGFALGIGDADLDLTGAGSGGTVTVRMGAGDLTVRVPQGTTATVTATVGAGDLTVRKADGSNDQHSGGGTDNDVTNYVVGSGATAVVLHAELGAGDLTIIEEKS